MSKAVMISIRPKWCEMIVNGKKTVEVRKTRPRLEPPFKCYIYCTKPRYPFEDFISYETEDGTVGFYGGGKVIGEFICEGIVRLYYEQFDDAKDENDGFYQWWDSTPNWARTLDTKSCLTSNDFHDYLGTKGGYAWHISNLIIYDQPRKIGEFRRICHNDLYCESCAMYHTHNGNCGNYSLQVQRQPQSWCYVEELEG